MDWLTHRIASSTRYSDSLVTIRMEWTLGDLVDAHEVLDMHDEVDALAAEKLELEQQRAERDRR